MLLQDPTLLPWMDNYVSNSACVRRGVIWSDSACVALSIRGVSESPDVLYDEKTVREKKILNLSRKHCFVFCLYYSYVGFY